MYIGFVNCNDNKCLSEKIIGWFKNFLWDIEHFLFSIMTIHYPIRLLYDRTTTKYIISLELLNYPINENDSITKLDIAHTIF